MADYTSKIGKLLDKIVGNTEWKSITVSPAWTLNSGNQYRTFSQLVGANEVVVCEGRLRFSNFGNGVSAEDASFAQPLQTDRSFDTGIDGTVNFSNGQIRLRQGYKGSSGDWITVGNIYYR